MYDRKTKEVTNIKSSTCLLCFLMYYLNVYYCVKIALWVEVQDGIDDYGFPSQGNSELCGNR